MFGLIGTILLIWLLIWLFRLLRPAFRAVRPIREMHKAYRKAQKEQQASRRETERRRTEAEQENRRRTARAAMRSYAQDVEYTETTDPYSGERRTTVREYSESQVTDAEWEDLK